MGFDLFTVDDVPEGVFDKVEGGKGYFRYSSGVTDFLQLVLGPDVLHMMCCPRREYCNGGCVGSYPTHLVHAMSMNNGFQITPNECEFIASKMTSDAFEKKVLGKEPPSNEYCRKYFGQSGPGWTEEPYTEASRKFFLDYANYCKKASKYGGFYVC